MHILVPSKGEKSWRELLRDPNTQWQEGYSAKELARSWESANGFPEEVASLFRTSDSEALREAEPLIAIPEHQVPLPGGQAASQNDVFVLARGGGLSISIMVEGKARESFGPVLGDWLRGASSGKRKRLEHLTSNLGLPGDLPDDIRYQLLHRTASAVLEARRFSAEIAVMVVQSFSADQSSLPDFERFVSLFGARHEPGKLCRLGGPKETELFAGWASARR